MKPTHSSSCSAQSNISLHFIYPSDSFNFERRCVRIRDVCTCMRIRLRRLARDLLRQLRHCFRIRAGRFVPIETVTVLGGSDLYISPQNALAHPRLYSPLHPLNPCTTELPKLLPKSWAPKGSKISNLWASSWCFFGGRLVTESCE